MPLPLFAAAALSSGISALGDIAGSYIQGQQLQSAQQASAREAQRQRRLQRQMLAFAQRAFAEGAPTRQAQYGAVQYALPLLQAEATRAPGTSLAFQRALEGGTRGLAGTLAQYGVSPDSSAFSRGVGELTGELTASDMARITGILQFLAGQAPDVTGLTSAGLGAAQGYGAQASQATGQVGQYGVELGGLGGSLASSLGGRFAQPFGLQYTFGLLSDPRFKELIKAIK